LFFLKNKYNELLIVTNKQISDLQNGLTVSNHEREIMQRKIVELELKNERLEHNYRFVSKFYNFLVADKYFLIYSIIEFSFSELESQKNQLVERNEMLITDLNRFVEDLQRLRDESRDLKQELSVRQKKDLLIASSTTIANPITNEKQMSIIVAASAAEACSGSPADVSGLNASKQSKPTKVSALNYVGDIFKKITVSVFSICEINKWSRL
jgi:hypothetical protein